MRQSRVKLSPGGRTRTGQRTHTVAQDPILLDNCPGRYEVLLITPSSHIIEKQVCHLVDGLAGEHMQRFMVLGMEGGLSEGLGGLRLDSNDGECYGNHGLPSGPIALVCHAVIPNFVWV